MPDTGFPINLVDVFAAKLGEMEGLSTGIIKRPLRLSDPAVCVGVHASEWVPRPDSQQIGQLEPAIGSYDVRVQHMVKHSNELEGVLLYTSIAKNIRVLLYRDAEFRQALGSLYEDLLGTRERVQRFGVRRQRYLSNDLKGAMVHLASTEFFVETEIATL